MSLTDGSRNPFALSVFPDERSGRRGDAFGRKTARLFFEPSYSAGPRPDGARFVLKYVTWTGFVRLRIPVGNNRPARRNQNTIVVSVPAERFRRRANGLSPYPLSRVPVVGSKFSDSRWRRASRDGDSEYGRTDGGFYLYTMYGPLIYVSDFIKRSGNSSPCVNRCLAKSLLSANDLPQISPE